MEISLTKNLRPEKSGKKEKGTNTRKNKKEKAHFQSQKQHLIVNMYTKFEVSILNSCGENFDEKFGEEEKRTNIGKNK